MSVRAKLTKQAERIHNAKIKIRNILVGFGLVSSSANIDVCAEALSEIKNNGAVTKIIENGEIFTIPKGYHNGEGKIICASGSSARIVNIELYAANWVGGSSPYSQVVEISGISAKSKVDLTPSVEQLEIFYEKDLSFVTENENGIVTVYVIGQKPTNDYTIQATVTEVNA